MRTSEKISASGCLAYHAASSSAFHFNIKKQILF